MSLKYHSLDDTAILGTQPMEIVTGYPPNIELIRTVFPVNGDTVFAWGDVIFSPQGEGLTPDLVYHEHVHRRQQQLFGGPELWWNEYLSNIDFRLTQELEAYFHQWQWVRRHLNDKIAKTFLIQYAKQLASPLYQFNIEPHQAETMIRKFRA
jgi:hypothetical protein